MYAANPTHRCYVLGKLNFYGVNLTCPAHKLCKNRYIKNNPAHKALCTRQIQHICDMCGVTLCAGFAIKIL